MKAECSALHPLCVPLCLSWFNALPGWVREVVLGHGEGGDALGILQIAACDSGQSIGEREMLEGDSLIVLGRCIAGVQTEGEIAMDLLGAEAGRGEERAERDDPVGGIAGLFGQFAGSRPSGGSSGSRVPAGTSSSIVPTA